MQDLIIQQMSATELKQLFRETVRDLITEYSQPKEEDEFGGIDLAVQITGKAKPTIYAMCSKRQIPHSKRGGDLYFSKQELLDWLRAGKRKTVSEIAAAAN